MHSGHCVNQRRLWKLLFRSQKAHFISHHWSFLYVIPERTRRGQKYVFIQADYSLILETLESKVIISWMQLNGQILDLKRCHWNLQSQCFCSQWDQPLQSPKQIEYHVTCHTEITVKKHFILTDTSAHIYNVKRREGASSRPHGACSASRISEKQRYITSQVIWTVTFSLGSSKMGLIVHLKMNKKEAMSTNGTTKEIVKYQHCGWQWRRQKIQKKNFFKSLSCPSVSFWRLSTTCQLLNKNKKAVCKISRLNTIRCFLCTSAAIPGEDFNTFMADECSVI